MNIEADESERKGCNAMNSFSGKGSHFCMSPMLWCLGVAPRPFCYVENLLVTQTKSVAFPQGEGHLCV